MSTPAHLPPKGRTNGCTCNICLQEHARRQAAYRAKVKLQLEEERATLAELKEFKANVALLLGRDLDAAEMLKTIRANAATMLYIISLAAIDEKVNAA